MFVRRPCLASRVPLDHLDAFSVSSGRASFPGEPLSKNASNALGAGLRRCLERAIAVERDPPTLPGIESVGCNDGVDRRDHHSMARRFAHQRVGARCDCRPAP